MDADVLSRALTLAAAGLRLAAEATDAGEAAKAALAEENSRALAEGDAPEVAVLRGLGTATIAIQRGTEQAVIRFRDTAQALTSRTNNEQY